MMKSVINQDVYFEFNDYEGSVFDVVEKFKKFILTQDCPFMIIDISKLNMIDAAKISILCSTFHFAKYHEGNIVWRVGDIEAERCIRGLKLKNIKIEIKVQKDSTIEYFDKKYRSNIL